ncbi:MP-2 [Clematis chlorotic mottle virus]|uniref:MP-2 n=1 Tax=Clematis chlorotic mottle virus TaxID=1950126 RepID=A0A1Q1MKB9_9TOMB|nr:MP-2 [Clematis chlorotic mottle virus]AQM36683.1 MP-2 [Clematis chlorotic mottle virus]AYV91501.1 movement protein 2 [Clematis chlorotic mottle virus]AYV91506.1 movement protein 2 [Clematis chlorotic mottle virus]
MGNLSLTIWSVLILSQLLIKLNSQSIFISRPTLWSVPPNFLLTIVLCVFFSTAFRSHSDTYIVSNSYNPTSGQDKYIKVSVGDGG